MQFCGEVRLLNSELKRVLATASMIITSFKGSDEGGECMGFDIQKWLIVKTIKEALPAARMDIDTKTKSCCLF